MENDITYLSFPHFVEHQERRLGKRQRHQMLQRDEADQKQMALGNRLRPADHERRRRRRRKDENSGHGAEHNSAIGVQNRRSLLDLHRIWGQIVDGWREERSTAPRGLHTLVYTGSSGYLESNSLRSFAVLVTEKVKWLMAKFFSCAVNGERCMLLPWMWRWFFAW